MHRTLRSEGEWKKVLTYRHCPLRHLAREVHSICATPSLCGGIPDGMPAFASIIAVAPCSTYVGRSVYDTLRMVMPYLFIAWIVPDYMRGRHSEMILMQDAHLLSLDREFGCV